MWKRVAPCRNTRSIKSMGELLPFCACCCFQVQWGWVSQNELPPQTLKQKTKQLPFGKIYYSHLDFPQKYMLQRYRAASQLQSCRYLHRWTWSNIIFHQRKVLQKCYTRNTHWDLICIKYLHRLSMWAEAKDLGGNPSHRKFCCKSLLSPHICILCQYCQQ